MKMTKFSLGICIALTFAACSSNRSEESELASADTLNTTAGLVADLPENSDKLVKTADLDFQVKDVYKSSSNIQKNVKNLGGLVMYTDIKTSEMDSKTIPVSNDSLQVISTYKIEAQMTVRVPSENLNDFVQAVALDATLIYSALVNIDDRSIDYLGSTLKQQSRQQILNKELNKDTLRTNDALQLADQQDAIIDGKMNNRRTDLGVRYSTVSLRFYQNSLLRKEIIPNNDLSAYQLPVYRRFVDALGSGFNFFLSIIIGIAHVWPVFIFGAGGWLSYRYIQRIKVKI
ncbi:DUF4349 domain-containing protein [Flavihumibacter sp. R14]|nr:DUF4349 domain-containing protein [Flavihumibacter soli]